jgi:hypothetical protein
MSHLNILNISREIDNINKNITGFHKQITEMEDKNNRNGEIINDLDDIKMNKLDVISSLEKIRDDFKFLESKINSVDTFVKKLVNRNIDYVSKNRETFKNFLKLCQLTDKKINVILYVLDCSNVQDFLSVSDEELKEYGFTHAEVNLLNRKCKEELEKNVYSDVGL